MQKKMKQTYIERDGKRKHDDNQCIHYCKTKQQECLERGDWHRQKQ